MSGGTYLLGGHRVHRVGFGAMQLPGRRAFGPPPDRQQALDVLRYAVAEGVDHIDTAQFYGPAVANELIHAALHPYPKGLVLVSKVGARRDDSGGIHEAQRPEQLRAGYWPTSTPCGSTKYPWSTSVAIPKLGSPLTNR